MICTRCDGACVITRFDGVRAVTSVCSECRGEGETGRKRSSFTELLDKIADKTEDQKVDQVLNASVLQNAEQMRLALAAPGKTNDPKNNSAPKNNDDAPAPRTSTPNPGPQKPREPSVGVFNEGFSYDRAPFRCDLTWRPGDIPPVFEFLGVNKKGPKRFYYEGGPTYAIVE